MAAFMPVATATFECNDVDIKAPAYSCEDDVYSEIEEVLSASGATPVANGDSLKTIDMRTLSHDGAASKARLGDGHIIEVVLLQPYSEDKAVAQLPKKELKTFGDVKKALAKLFGAEAVTEIKFVMKTTRSLVNHRQSDLVRTRRVFVTGM